MLANTIWIGLSTAALVSFSSIADSAGGGGGGGGGGDAAASSGGGARGNGIVGSPHDFSNQAWNNQRELCRVCHVPHDNNMASMRGAQGMLWNHELSSATYTMYASPSLDGTTSGQPTGTSKLCLGCHDGTVALDAFDMNGSPAPGVGTFIQDVNPDFRVPGGNYWTGNVGDLRATHPISMVYDENADGGLAPKTTAFGGSGTIADVLEGGRVQCSSCHDVHDSPGESVPGTHLLRVAQTPAQGGRASGLCLTCHVK